MNSANRPITSPITSSPATPCGGTENPIRPQYRGKKGPVPVAITHHCRARFRERWARAFPNKPLGSVIDAEITQRFNRATRITQLGSYEKKRMARHGKDTLYFRADGFTFIVQDSAIVTVELSDRGMRHLNRGGLAA